MIPPVSKYTVLVYCFSLLQAASMYLFAAYYDGVNRFFDESETASASKIAAVLGSTELPPLTFSVSNIITSTQPPSQKHPKKADKDNDDDYDDYDDDDHNDHDHNDEEKKRITISDAISLTSNNNISKTSLSSNQ